jgi:hypothetical protein
MRNNRPTSHPFRGRGFVKIGRGLDPERRARAVQAGHFPSIPPLVHYCGLRSTELPKRRRSGPKRIRRLHKAADKVQALLSCMLALLSSQPRAEANIQRGRARRSTGCLILGAADFLAGVGWPARNRSPSTNTSSSRTTVSCHPG